MSLANTSTALTAWQRRCLYLLLAITILFGCLVVYRSAFLQRRMGDLGCYLRAAWAVRAGEDLYGVTDDNDWHYNYPPLLAVLLTPFADPPANLSRDGYAPFWLSVAVWYVFGLVALGIGVHALAKAIEATQHDDPPPLWSQPWWRLRMLPVVVCLPMIGHSLMRGQANLIALGLICGMAAGLMRGRRFAAGLCLAGAACIKVFPAFLILIPLVRRDVRCLAGVLAGGFIGMILVPTLAFGPEAAVAHYRTYASVLLGPALGQGGDLSRKEEILGVNSTDSHSFKELIHNTLHPSKYGRPKQLQPWVVPMHFVLGASLTLVTLLAARRRSLLHEPSVVGCMMIVGVLVSPICHLHYFCYALPLIMGLVARQAELSRPIAMTFAFFIGCNIIPHLPGMYLTRDLGLAAYGTLAVWLIGVVVMARRRRQHDSSQDACWLDERVSTADMALTGGGLR